MLHTLFVLGTVEILFLLYPLLSKEGERLNHLYLVLLVMMAASSYFALGATAGFIPDDSFSAPTATALLVLNVIAIATIRGIECMIVVQRKRRSSV